LEDAIDDAFLRIGETRDTAKDQFDRAKGSFGAWIGTIAYQIARNRARDYRRRATHEVSGINVNVATPEPVIRDQLPERDLSIDIRDFLRTLPEEQRDCIALWLTRLTYQEFDRLPDQEQSHQLLVSPKNVTLEEIAVRLDKTVTSVHRLKRLVHLRLKEYLITKGYSNPL
jgi:RNA polymerase sigma factor (sigma-70 family)